MKPFKRTTSKMAIPRAAHHSQNQNNESWKLSLTIIILSCLVLLDLINPTESSTYVVKPTTGAATMIPGQPLHFECAQLGKDKAQFLWSKRNLEDKDPHLMQPDEDDTVEIHNERLTLNKPNFNSLGDYICSALDEASKPDSKEYAVIKLRAQPYIVDFGIPTSHTGKSATISDGERLEMVCSVPDRSSPVNITWLRSDTSDDERLMVPLPEVETVALLAAPNQPVAGGGPMLRLHDQDVFVKTYSPPGNIFVERVDNFTKRLVVNQVGPEHRGFYTCLADNGVTERSRKTIFIRVQDNIIALWPFLGILAELFILFTIIHIWETQKAYRESQQPLTSSLSSSITNKNDIKNVTPSRSAIGTSKHRAPSGPTNAFESVPLNS